MRHLLLLVAIALAVPEAAAQFYPSVADAHLVHVYLDDGQPVFETEGQYGSNGPMIAAGGTLVVRASDSLHVLVVVEDDNWTPGTDGRNALVIEPWLGIGVLRMRSLIAPDGSSGPTYHHVSVFVCTEAVPPPSGGFSGAPGACRTWQAAYDASGDGPEPGFTLTIVDGIQVYAAPAPRPDPPMDPIDRQ